MDKPNKRILSGVQPSGDLHLGNYLGAIKNFVSLQDEYECFFCVVDLHAITVWQDPKKLADMSREVTAAFIASGTQAPTPTRDDVKSLRPKVGRDRSYMERVLRQYQTDAVQPPEMTCYALTDAPEAQRVSEGRHLRGKLMLKIL